MTRKNLTVFMMAGFTLLSVVSTLFVFSPPKASAAATCYKETGAFQVEPETHACPSGATYRDASGNVITDYNTGTRCFVAPAGSSRSSSLTYREQSCANLESLRTNAKQAACVDSGGTWSPANPMPGDSGAGNSDTCVCPSFTSLRPNARCESYDPSVPTSTDSTINEPKSIESDCEGTDIQAGQPIDSENHCAILDYLVLAINLLSALVGIVVVGSIIYGGIQYSSAGSDPQKISAAKERIRNALIALLVFIFAYSFLNYLVPGGVL